MKIESVCFEENKFCIETEEKYLEFEYGEIEYQDEEEIDFIIEDEEEFKKLFDLLPKDEENLDSIECKDLELIHYFEEENFSYNILYDAFSFKPKMIGIHFWEKSYFFNLIDS